MPPHQPGVEDEPVDTDIAEEPRAAGATTADQGPPRRRGALQVRTARFDMVASAMEKVSQAHEALIDTPKAVLEGVRETVATSGVLDAASRSHAGSAMHQAEAAQRLNKVLKLGYQEVGEALLEGIERARAAPPTKTKFEVIVDAGERLAGRLATKIVDKLGPGVIDKLAAKFLGDTEDAADKDPATPAATTRAESAPAATARSVPAPDGAATGAGAGVAREEIDPLRAIYEELSTETRATMSFVAFCDATGRAQIKADQGG